MAFTIHTHIHPTKDKIVISIGGAGGGSFTVFQYCKGKFFSLPESSRTVRHTCPKALCRLSLGRVKL